MVTEFKELLGKVLTDVVEDGYEVRFVAEDGDEFLLAHLRDCCEVVYLEDVNGDIKDLIGSRITIAEEVSSDKFTEEFEKSFSELDEDGYRVTKSGETIPDSYTWTFYKVGTIKGVVVFRFYGVSNGYYSESVDFFKKEDGVFHEYL